MDASFTSKNIEFRDQVRKFIKLNFSDENKQLLLKAETAKQGFITWQKKLYQQGWIAANWPVEYGGTGWSPVQKYIFETERALAGAPAVIPFGITMIGPIIYTFGNDEQKARFLPGILSSDEWWCQGYSEPGAGSDLAALETKAVMDGDNYIVNGTKIWTTYAQHADWIFCLVRTDNNAKQQHGISFLMIDMKSDGITVNPIQTIDGHHSLNEVVFDNVRVPVVNCIGEENRGWTYAKFLLTHERSSIAGVADSRIAMHNVIDKATVQVNSGIRLLDTPLFQAKLTEIEIELMALEYTELRVLASLAAGEAPGAESSLLKIKGTEIQQRLQELQMQALGSYAGVDQLNEQSDDSQLDGYYARREYMYGRAATIYGGSNEIQRNVIAKAVLGL